MPLTYKAKDSQTTVVRLDGRITGKIVESQKGFRYMPTGCTPGDFFPTMAACMHSLEEV